MEHNHNYSIKYKVHEQSIGWHPWVTENTTVGDGNKRIEAIKIILEGFPTHTKVKYRAHVESHGWQDWVENGMVAGTEGLGKRMEALEVKLESVDGFSICCWTLVGARQGATLPQQGGPSQGCDGHLSGTVGRRRPIHKIKLWITPI
jgi:uncharacterized protein YjdB